VRVRRPRIGQLHARDQVAEARGDRGPDTEGAVDVQPRPGVPAGGRDLGQRVESAGVHLTGLGADDGGTRRPLERVRQRVDPHAALVVRCDRLRRAEAEQSQRPVDRHVPFLADEDANPWPSRQAFPADVPTGVVENVPARRRETGHVGNLGARDEPDRRLAREAEKLEQPVPRHLLDDRGRRPGGVEAGVLVPGGREPVRRERRGQAASDHEPEVAPAPRRDDAGPGVLGELDHDLRRVERLVGQRPAKGLAQLFRSHVRKHGPLVEALDVVGGDLRGPAQ
jgi:hypothetical protein